MPHHTHDDRKLNSDYNIIQDYDRAEEHAILRDFHFKNGVVHRGVDFHSNGIRGTNMHVLFILFICFFLGVIYLRRQLQK